MALILLSEEDIDPTGSDVRCVRKDRICDIILQLYLSAQCQITPLTKSETGPHMENPSLGFARVNPKSGKLPCALKWLEKTVILGGEKAKN